MPCTGLIALLNRFHVINSKYFSPYKIVTIWCIVEESLDTLFKEERYFFDIKKNENFLVNYLLCCFRSPGLEFDVGL